MRVGFPQLSIALSVIIVTLVLTVPFGIASSSLRGQLVLGFGEQGWDGAYVYRPSVVYDGSSFMMWYTGGTQSGTGSIGLATSTDGITWSRYPGNPVLKSGSAGDWDSSSVQEAWVIREQGEYKMWFTGGSGHSENYPVGYATSADGIHWTKYAKNPVLTISGGGAYAPVVVSTGSSYIMYYGTWGLFPQIWTATSNDGTNWTRNLSPISIPTSGSWDSAGKYVGGITRMGGLYVMSYHGLTEPDQIGLAKSTDGLEWAPYSGNPVITYGSHGSWDGGEVFLPMTVVVGQQYYVYYTGTQTLGANTGQRIGLAVLSMSQYPIPEYGLTALVIISVILVTMITLRRRSTVRDLRN